MQYQAQPIIASYLASIIARTREAEIDHLWTNLLGYYFPPVEDFGIEREAYIQPQSQIRANVSVKALINNSRTTILMIENKRPSAAVSGNPPNHSWANAEAQLERYMLLRRANETSNVDLFGIVGIGKCVKFFRLRRARSVLETYRRNIALRLDRDSSQIEEIIDRIKTYIEQNR